MMQFPILRISLVIVIMTSFSCSQSNTIHESEEGLLIIDAFNEKILFKDDSKKEIAELIHDDNLYKSDQSNIYIDYHIYGNQVLMPDTSWESSEGENIAIVWFTRNNLGDNQESIDYGRITWDLAITYDTLLNRILLIETQF